MNLAFYIHIPYCVKRCGYCDFNTYTPAELQLNEGLTQISNSYIDLLVKEIEFARNQVGESAIVPSIFFGGGTPSLMEASDIKRVITAISKQFKLDPIAEVTLETNPDTVTREKLKQFYDAGVNRISFGMQSSVPHVLKTLDRTHNPENLPQVTKWASEVGFKEISVDLIYGTPGESKQDWQQSIDSALALPISHISAYALIVEEGTKLAAQIKRGEITKLDDDLTAEKYIMADKAFTAAGFNWYELSNWSKPGGQCRHNIAYWDGSFWWGVGAGAHSYLNGKRWWNVKHPSSYQEKILQGQSPELSHEILTPENLSDEFIMLQIRRREGILHNRLSSAQIAKAEEFLSSGFLDSASWQDMRLVLSRDGRLIADKIVRELVL